MDAKKPLRVVIDDEGAINAIYSDELVEAGIFGLGQPETYRASEVEPYLAPATWPERPQQTGEWCVTITDRAQAELYEDDSIEWAGPYRLRSKALDAEVAWLTERLFK